MPRWADGLAGSDEPTRMDGAAHTAYDRAAALAELAAVETNLHMLLAVYGQRLEREAAGAGGGVAGADQQVAVAAPAALPELQHHVTAFLASAKALDDQFAAVQVTAGGESAASVSEEVDRLKAELATKDALLAKQSDNLVKWQLLFAKLAADATAMADDPEA